MARFKDLRGRVFGILSVMFDAGYRDGNDYRVWQCRCACGSEVRVSAKNLNRGSATTCGCRQIKRYTLSGREYRIWTDMKTRCYNPNASRYPRYGGRGITVCDRWKHDFKAFLKDMGPCPKGLSIDRIDNDGDYEPSNCKWSDPRQQTINSSHARMLTKDGRTQCIADWSRELGIPQKLIQGRLYRGWPDERALTTERFINKYA